MSLGTCVKWNRETRARDEAMLIQCGTAEGMTDGLDWKKLLDPALGGPGEPPARPERVELPNEERRALPEAS